MNKFNFKLVVDTSIARSHTYKGVLRHTYRFNPEASCRLFKSGKEIFAGQVALLKAHLFQDLRESFDPFPYLDE